MTEITTALRSVDGKLSMGQPRVSLADHVAKASARPA